MRNDVVENIFEEDTQKGVFLTFYLGDEQFGLPITNVIEIVGVLPINEIPEAPEYIKGISNLRGEVIPIMDARLRFKKNLIEYTDKTCLIVTKIQESLIGLIVDGVSEVKYIPEEGIVDNPMINSANSNKYIKKIARLENEMILILETEQLISKEEFEEINIF